jgi:hypothetical protein
MLILNQSCGDNLVAYTFSISEDIYGGSKPSLFIDVITSVDFGK